MKEIHLKMDPIKPRRWAVDLWLNGKRLTERERMLYLQGYLDGAAGMPEEVDLPF